MDQDYAFGVCSSAVLLCILGSVLPSMLGDGVVTAALSC